MQIRLTRTTVPLVVRAPLLMAAALLSALPACEGCGQEEALDEVRIDLCLRPSDLDFGDVEVRTDRAATIAVTNCGNIPIVGVSAEIAAAGDGGSGEEAFHLLETQVPKPLEEGGFFYLPVRFRPPSARQYSGRLVFTLTAETGESTTSERALTGRGVEAGTCELSTEPAATLTFGATEVGVSDEKDVVLTNTGSGPCALSGARIVESGQEDFFVVERPRADLPAGSQTTVRVRFGPKAVGQRTATLAVVVGGQREERLSVVGSGVTADACELRANPATMVFPRAAVGYTETIAQVVVESSGERPCTIASATVTTGAGDFALTSAPAPGAVLDPAMTTVLGATFSPAQTGARSGVVTVTTQEGFSLTVPLSGFGDPAPTCSLRIQPSPVTFDPLAVGLSVEAEVTVENASPLPCNIAGTRLAPGSEPDFAIVAAPGTGTLDPGGSLQMRVRFAPQAAALALGKILIDLGDGLEESFDLIGFGDYADLRLTPSLQHFGIITEGCASDTWPIALTNVGPVAARLDDVGFSALTDPNFELIAPISGGTLLASGAAVELPVRMLGAALAGGHHGHLVVASTGTVQPVVRTELQGTTQGTDEAARTDMFVQRQRPAVDILFVVDNSGSMSSEQQSLGQNFNSFIAFTVGLDIDYHIGVVTTDVSTTATAGRLVAPFIANRGTNPTPDPVAAFVAMANVGSDGSGTEKGLEASVLALTAPRTDPGGTSDGFLRDDAVLSIVYVSDEEDQSAGAVSDYVDRLLEVKNYQPQAVVASSIVGDVPQGCRANGNSAQAGARYYDVTTAFGGAWASICAADWATTMQQVGLATYAALTRFELSQEPAAGTLVVTVNGQVIPQDPVNGWTYDSDSNAIVFHGTSVPLAGEQVSISYTARCIAP